jgi:DNA-binding winged helix-turn-helix (wHTH) protein
MAGPVGSGSVFQFGAFELDLQARELRKRGIRVKLQDQPLQILFLLIECAGEVVTREQIQKKLWCVDTFVDFENSINGAVRRLRDALGDTSENPRFVETVARHGYRFVAPVSRHPATDAPAPENRLKENHPSTSEPAQDSRKRSYWLSGVLCGVSLVAGGSVVSWLKRGYVEPLRVETLTYSGRDASPAVSPDGKTVAFSSGPGRHAPDLAKTIEGWRRSPADLRPGRLAPLFTRWRDDSLRAKGRDAPFSLQDRKRWWGAAKSDRRRSGWRLLARRTPHCIPLLET